MRIAIVNWTARRAGGAETYVGAVLPALRRAGHDVFFCHEVHEPPGRDPIDGVADGPSCSVSTDGLKSALDAMRRFGPDVLFVQRVESIHTERALLEIAPAVFFAHGYYGTCISGTKTVQLPVLQPCQREFGPACLLQYFPRRCGGLSPRTMIAEYRRQSARLALLRKYGAIATFSDHMRREYLRHGFSPDRVVQLPPIDPAARQPPRLLNPIDAATTGAARSLGRDGDAVRLAFIGRIDYLKGVRVLLEALPLLRPRVARSIVLTVAGDGPDLDACRAIVRRHEVRRMDIAVEFLGWTSREDCVRLVDQSDVVVVPSLWPEPFGLIGIEALRRGVPVAAFAVGGIPEWLEDGKTGALAPGDPPTADGLAEAVRRCLTSDDIRRTVRERAVANVPDYSIERHVRALVPLLATVAGHSATVQMPEAIAR